MNLTQKNKIPKATIILNVMAVVMAIFAIFNIYTSNKYISGLVEQGFDPSGQVSEVINYYLVAVTPYVFYGICLVALGYIIRKVVCLVDTQNIRILEREDLDSKSVEKDEDDEIDMILRDLED